MEKMPIGILAKRYGNLGRRLWYMCQGADPDPVKTTVSEAKSMGHGKVLPPGTQSDQIIIRYFGHLCERLAYRLRINNMSASCFYIGMNCENVGWISHKEHLVGSTNDALTLLTSCNQFLKMYNGHGVIRQIQITALNPKIGYDQLDLFSEDANTSKVSDKINNIKDQLFLKFGFDAIKSARQLENTDTVSVIAPAWRPDGARQSIQKNQVKSTKKITGEANKK